MSSPELGYAQFRSQVEKFNEEAEPYSFCKAIKGGCCSPDIVIQVEDGAWIKDAVQNGDISQDTVERAIKRAKNPQVDRCPFLGEQNECTIYENRPLVCIAHGNGGYPLDPDKTRAILRGSTEDIAPKELGVFSCENCAPLIDGEERLPAEIVRKSTIIRIEVEAVGPFTSMRDFILEELPQS